MSETRQVRIESLHVYPFKSCRGIAINEALLTERGIQGDRTWMAINEHGRFLSQREFPRMALIGVALDEAGIRLDAPGMSTLKIGHDECQSVRTVSVWRDTLSALDAGDQAAEWFSTYLNASARVVWFDKNTKRASSRDFTHEIEALNSFSDGYPILAIGESSLRDLNSRLTESLPMNRFRPNIVLSGLDPYEEDSIREMRRDGIVLRIVKSCTRCKITTVDQATGVATGDDPLATLKRYRWDARLKGVTFGQNVIIIEGVGQSLHVGDAFAVSQ